MKNIRNIILVAFIALVSVSFFSCGETPSAKFLKEYEAFVVSAEKSAKSNDVSKLEALAKKEAQFTKKAGQLSKDTSSWTISDAGKYTALTARWTAAEAKLSALKVKKEAGKAAEKTCAALKDLGSKLKK